MIIKLNQENFDNKPKKPDINWIVNILQENSIGIISSDEVSCVLTNDRGTKKTIFKDKSIFEYLNEDPKKTITAPTYSIVDEENKEINLVFIRTQKNDGSGTAYQKLPYGDFALKDYLRAYDSLIEYDVKVTLLLNDHFYDKRYINLIKYLRGNSINVWISEIKIKKWK